MKDKVTITSHNQSGGITAQNISGLNDKPPKITKNGLGKLLKIVVGILTALASIVAIVAFFK